jgi:phosphatidylserine decarboxylase
MSIDGSNDDYAGSADRAFALLQDLLPQHALSRAMHRLARSESPTLRRALIRTVLKAYPQIDLREAAQPDPAAYRSFNAFFTRALRADARPVEVSDDAIVSPVDGTVSQLGTLVGEQILQAKGTYYTRAALLADEDASPVYAGGAFACLYLAPYNYHRIHMPIAGRLTHTRYVPGRLFSVSASTVLAVPGLFARNERVVCEFDTALGPLAMVLVGALFVGSIETVYAGEINPPSGRRGVVRQVEAGIGREFPQGTELGRFNMGSTVVMLLGRCGVRFADGLAPGASVRMGQRLASLA